MPYLYKKIVSLSILILFSGSIWGQIRSEGTPVFFGVHTKSEVPCVTMSGSNNKREKVLQLSKSSSKLKVMPFASMHRVALSTSNSGRWDTLADGRRVWRLTLSSKGAYSIGLMLSKYKLPKGAQLFVYNQQNRSILGAYTNVNNKSFGSLVVEPLKGDEVTLELIEPGRVEFYSSLEVGGVLHDYLNIFKYLGKTSLKKTSGSCNVNINCPEGADWRRERNSVCRIVYVNDQDGLAYLGTGVLVNNVRRDAKPFMLTAHHVFESPSEASNSVFYFNYESLTCEGSSGDESHTISGSDLRATTDKLDFTLVELTQRPPELFHPYYAGWDRTGKIPANTTCIHHPSGDVKKISKDFDSPSTSTYNDGSVFYDFNTHWRIARWDVGTTEGGSSGSPLFDENHRIVGDLTGGDANCQIPEDDYYAKLSASWANYPQNNEQLGFWLDPDNQDVDVLDGFNPFASIFAGFSTGETEFCVGEAVVFINTSQGEELEYLWDFGLDAFPATATGEVPPEVVYATGGEKIVSLTIRKDDKSDMVQRQITVEEPPVADFTYKIKGLTVTFSSVADNAKIVRWDFGDGTSVVGNEVEHKYFNPGNFTVRMTASNTCGENQVSQSVSTSYDDQVVIFPNPGDGNVNIDLSRLSFDVFRWSIYDGRGARIGNGILNDSENTLKVDLTNHAGGLYVLRMDIDGVVVIRKLIVL